MTQGQDSRLPRSSGLLLHPTSLPGPFGIGDLGPAVLEFLDVLVETGQRWWQLLPLGPTGYGNSPYQSYSSFAGNPMLISPERLAESRWLSPDDWADWPTCPEDHVDFDAVIAAKSTLLRRAFANFKPVPPDFDAFVAENAAWLDDYSLFMALKEAHGGSAWYDWAPPLVRREPEALASARAAHAESVRFYQVVQYMFAMQWRSVRMACQARSISILGDLPIFVAQDSADVWARPELFWLDAQGRSTFVAGVPPDYFAASGQLWGNPLYRWQAHAAEGYAWWVGRIRGQTERVDLVRLDHFRGFEAYWEIPADSPTAVNGRWSLGPGSAFFEAVRNAFGTLPLVAEDLGDISPEVGALRDRFDLPGMRVLQFGFGGAPGTDFHLPYTYVPHCIAYTGTHDNDTTHGWFSERPHGDPAEQAYHREQRRHACRVIGSRGDEPHWDAIRATLSSVADTAIIPVQDLLGLGSAARMNVPGLPHGNWSWRLRPGQIRPGVKTRLADMTAAYGRWNGPIPPPFAPPRAPIAAAEVAKQLAVAIDGGPAPVPLSS